MAGATAPVVIITGCSAGGIGFALCDEFATRGCVVYATGRNLGKVKGFSYDSVRTMALDVTQDEDVARVVNKIIEAEGRIDVLVNNAGVLVHAPAVDVTLEQIKNVFDTNTFGSLRMAKAVIPHMVSRKCGTIVNIGSILGNIPMLWNSAYSASKAALHSLSEVLYMECRRLGVHVMLVAPGAVRTHLGSGDLNDYALPADSLYKALMGNIVNQLHEAHDPVHASAHMSAQAFARPVVTAVLQKRPPRYLTLGPWSSLFAILGWLPRGFVLWLVSRHLPRI